MLRGRNVWMASLAVSMFSAKYTPSLSEPGERELDRLLYSLAAASTCEATICDELFPRYRRMRGSNLIPRLN